MPFGIHRQAASPTCSQLDYNGLAKNPKKLGIRSQHGHALRHALPLWLTKQAAKVLLGRSDSQKSPGCSGQAPPHPEMSVPAHDISQHQHSHKRHLHAWLHAVSCSISKLSCRVSWCNACRLPMLTQGLQDASRVYSNLQQPPTASQQVAADDLVTLVQFAR